MLFSELEQDIQDELAELYISNNLQDMVQADLKWRLSEDLGIGIEYAWCEEDYYDELVLSNLEIRAHQFAAYVKACGDTYTADFIAGRFSNTETFTMGDRYLSETLSEIRHTCGSRAHVVMMHLFNLYLAAEGTLDTTAELYRELCREILEEDTETQYEADGRWIRDC